MLKKILKKKEAVKPKTKKEKLEALMKKAAPKAKRLLKDLEKKLKPLAKKGASKLKAKVGARNVQPTVLDVLEKKLKRK